MDSGTSIDDHTLLLSVVIPIFNAFGVAERHRRLIQDLDVSDVEFIFVDDGSTDGSASLLEAWVAAVRPRVRVSVISQENRGPGGARNAGIRSARGRFVWFVDADDELMVDVLSVLRAAPADIDEVWFRHQDGNRPADPHEFAVGVHTCEGEIRLGVLRSYGVLNARVFRHSWLQHHRVEYPEFAFFEDNAMEFVLPFLTRRFMVSDAVGYRIHLQPNSITRFDRPPDARHFDRLLTAILGLEAGLSHDPSEEERELLEKKFELMWWATRLNRGPGVLGSVIMMLRAMRQYRTEHTAHGLRFVPRDPPHWRRSQLVRRLGRVLWPMAAALPSQNAFFCGLRREAWLQPMRWSLARHPYRGSMAECGSEAGTSDGS